MPSVDVIRNVTIRGKAEGVDDATSALARLTQQLQATNQNLNLGGARVANDNLKQIADNTAALNRQMLNLDQSTRAATESSGIHWGGLVLKIAAVAAGLGALYTVAKVAYEAVTVGPRLLGEAWDLAGKRLDEYVKLSEKAAAANTTTDFFQRISKGAADAKLPVESLTAALAKLNDATAGKLGGSAAQLAIDPLSKAGNFAGNGGVAQLAGANGTEEKLRAVVALWDQAIAKGERLAAIEVVRVTLGDEIARKAAADAGYLDKMLASADALSKTDLIDGADVARAVELQDRLDAAEKILSQRWHPIQDLLTELGIKFRETWVSIVELTASAFDNIAKMVEKLGAVPSWFQGVLNKGATWFVDQTTTPESRAAAEKQYGITSDPTEMAALTADQRRQAALRDGTFSDAQRRLAEGMNRRLDTSHPLNDNNTTPDTSAYDRATESVLKYNETTRAASLSVSDAAREQEKFKVIAQLTAAGMKDGLTPEAAKLKAEMSGLGEKAGAAADALAKARQVSQIEFGRRTAFLSQEDVQIANQLKGIYGNDIPSALNSTYAAGIRVNNAFQQISSSIETSLTQGLTDIATGAQTAGNAFANMGKMILTAIEQMIIKITIVQPLMQALQSTISGGFGGGGSLLSLLGIGGGGGGGAALGMGGIGHFHAGGIIGSEATFSRAVDPAVFAGAPRFHTGGIAGDEVPIIAKRGEGVFTQGQMAAMGGGGQQTNITYAPVIDARGADAQAVARLAAALADDRKNFQRNVQGVMAKTRQNNPGSF